MNKIIRGKIIEDLLTLGLEKGDVVLIRATLGAIGRIDGGANTFINALLDVVGPEGTIVSLAFTQGTFILKVKKEETFTLNKKSYAGALPNAMISYIDSKRSSHPMCSYVAIGKHAIEITKDHDASSPAYEPIRKIIALNGKCVLVGCVGNSPGFTTTHLAEYDLGHLKKFPIFPWLSSVYYFDKNGDKKIFRRKDPGLCSNSFYKFYALYVKEGVLKTGNIGKAYSILGLAKELYEIDYKTLSKNPKFNICGSPDCMTCSARRWDRLHHAPIYFFRRIINKLSKMLKK